MRAEVRRLVHVLEDAPDALTTLAQLVDELPIAMAVLDGSERHRCLYANPALRASLRLANRSLDLLPLNQLMAIESGHPLHASLARVLLSRRPDLVSMPIDSAAGGGECAVYPIEGDHRCYLLLAFVGWRQPERRTRRDRHGGDRSLTAREREVCRLVAEGLDNGEIASRLRVRRTTVATHVAAALAKLGFTSRVQIAAWAVARHLVADVEMPDREG